MARVMIAIMIVFMAVGPIAHGYLAFKYNALQTLSPEEETHDDKPHGKEKFDIKDQYLHPIATYNHITDNSGNIDHLHQLLILSKGYAGTLLMPPEMH
jgi:hypothetical protein